jgi:hypothetical protein
MENTIDQTRFDKIVHELTEQVALKWIVQGNANPQTMAAALQEALANNGITVGEPATMAAPGKVFDLEMMDAVGEYDDPEEVEEWAWVEQNASYAHTDKEEFGAFDYILSLCKFEGAGANDIPANLKPFFEQAAEQDCTYMMIHQGS